ncbi:MAG: type I glutamate--ammonia ligase [Candidatus Latescibacteria bacterium]|nr:type I glutamate--ammonia ligase [Candidatus Latescibacterota bacterium]
MAKTTRGAKSGASPAQSVIQMAKANGAQFVDFKFVDLPGIWQHFAIPIHELTEEVFAEGLGFDGSSIRGWKAINESDMLVIPDPGTAFMDPFFALPTLSLTCSIQEPITREDYNRDPRSLAARAVEYLKSTGIADTAYFGPEAEFFVFDDVRFDQNAHEGYYHLDSVEARWNMGRQEGPNLGSKIPYKGGYFPVAPADTQADLRAEMVATMMKCGIDIERDHHEVATAGQAEIDIRFCSMLTCADQMMLYKYIVRNVARRNGKTATFMPKPLFQDNGSGMHTHQSLWKGGKPLFAGSGYAGLSEMALYYIGGLLKHAPAILALSNPTTNSYRRLVPGYEAPVNLAYSQRNRSASIRIPMYSPSPKAKRVEFRCPDASCNMYLAFAAMLMAGLDGIQNKINPGQPLDKNIYDLAPEEAAKVPTTPGSLDAALVALEKDHAFLLRGNVFSTDLINAWIGYKRETEVDAVRLRPHPYEFVLYYDV